jgi:hypothetical protein
MRGDGFKASAKPLYAYKINLPILFSEKPDGRPSRTERELSQWSGNRPTD